CVGRRDWRSARSLHLDQPAAGILAARSAAASRGKGAGGHPALEHERSGGAPGSRGTGKWLSGAGEVELGPVFGSGAESGVSPDLSSVQLARLGGLGHGPDWRYGRASDGPLDVGAEAGLSDNH